MGPAIGIAVLIPVLVIGVYFLVSYGLTATMGWFALAELYPNRPVKARARFAMQSARMKGGVNINNALTLEVCDEGLRFSTPRLFLPFCEPFLVPWSEIVVERFETLVWKRARLSLGQPVVSAVAIDAALADRIGRAAPGQWPEPGPFPREPAERALTRLGVEWALSTAMVAIFLLLAPWLATRGRFVLPLGAAVGAPAALFLALCIFRYSQLRQS
jgi:hypothetical protein